MGLSLEFVLEAEASGPSSTIGAHVSVALVSSSCHDKKHCRHRESQLVDSRFGKIQIEAGDKKNQTEEEIRRYGCGHRRSGTDTITLLHPGRQDISLPQLVRAS